MVDKKRVVEKLKNQVARHNTEKIKPTVLATNETKSDGIETRRSYENSQ